jgi:hypothetical protein
MAQNLLELGDWLKLRKQIPSLKGKKYPPREDIKKLKAQGW